MECYVSEVIDAPVDRVWETVRPFSSLRDWHPWVEECTIEDGNEQNQIGAVRNFTVQGDRFRERLVAMSDLNYSKTYSMLDSPDELTLEDHLGSQYRGQFSLTKVSQSNQTFVEWSNQWDAPDNQISELREFMLELFSVGLSNLKDIHE